MIKNKFLIFKETYTRVPPTDKHRAEKCGKYELVAPT